MFEGVPFELCVNWSSIGDFMITKTRCDFGRKNLKGHFMNAVEGTTLAISLDMVSRNYRVSFISIATK